MYLKRILSASIFLILVLNIIARSQNESPGIKNEDRIRIAAAYELNKQMKDDIWDGWGNTNFNILLVTDKYEYLIGYPGTAQGFTYLRYDSLLGNDVYYRNKVFQTSFLATFPVVSMIPTIVIGTAENTRPGSSTPWLVTLMHEHFHQLQMSKPEYFEEVKALNLARGDSTGMWMLNFPFPYDSVPVQNEIKVLCSELTDAIESPSDELGSRLKKYLSTREELKQLITPDDFNYLSFQLWQEGIAMYTEYRVAKYASERFTPPDAFISLKDYTPFDSSANSIHRNIISQLKKLNLGEARRVIFYYIGAGEALLLDRVNPEWKNRYFKEKFYLDKYFK